MFLLLFKKQALTVLNLDAWHETVLSAQSSWSLFQHSQGAQDAVVSTASLRSQKDVLDVAFTLSRDKKLKIWSLARHKLIKTFDLGQLVSCFTSTDQVALRNDSYKHSSLFPSMALPYLHVFHTDSIDADYGAYLALYAPQSHSFLFFGIDVDDAGQVSQLVPILQKPLETGFTAELVDFKAAKVDRKALAGDSNDSSNWTLWTLWAVGKQTQMAFIELPELESLASGASSEAFESGWIPVVRPVLTDVFVPSGDISLSDLAEDARLDASVVAKAVGERYLDHLFLPGRYSIGTLESALVTYLQSSAVDEPPKDADAPFRDIVATGISSAVSLKTSAKTGEILVADYLQDLEAEWARYTAIANEIKLEAGFPLALCVDNFTNAVITLERESLSVPVLQNEATLLRSQVAAGTNHPFLAIPEEQLADAYPHLAPVSIRETVLTLCNLARTLFNAAEESQSGLLEGELLNLVSEAPSCTLAEAAAGIYDAVIASSALADGSDREKLLAQLADLPLLAEAFDALLQILSPDLCHLPTLDGDLFDLQEPSYISLALVTSIIMEALESRYGTALDIVSLLCVIQAEQEDLIPNFDQVLNSFFAAFHQLFNLRGLSQSPTVPIGDSEDENTNDSLTAHLGALSMGQGASQVSSLPLDAFSLLNALLRKPPISPLPLTTYSSSLIQCASAFLESTGLFLPKRAIEASLQDAAFAFRLFSIGCSFEALTFADSYPKSSFMEYVRGRALLDMGDIDNATNAFELAAADTGKGFTDDIHSKNNMLILFLGIVSISTILIGYSDIEQELSPALYYRHVADLFFQHDTRQPVFSFCSLSVEAGLDELDEDVRREVWLRLFQSANEISQFQDAYSTMIRIPFEDLCVVS